MDNQSTLKKIEMELSNIEKMVDEIITFSLNTIKSEPSLEKDILKIFMSTSTRITNYFMKETENTNTEHVGKNVIKYAMFKKF
ncbi:MULTISPECIES: hypothetical protein [unclassified Clostridium]|uniref:hypothetical protein n=1 Tax=unclassified Clostridium TaxID=2614128 RepID=UPI00029842BB|nr:MULTISPECIES: hypothetical protein [unclassified Clostridium]EKQ57396.1 MAG: hypothetical protein A370_00967 [Clostridium sp. Maddingley MBC34-26]